MNNLLIEEPPLQVLPGLAVAIGLNEAILLQQIHYWIKKSSHRYDDRTWIYNSATKWQKQFPFWSESTIRRTVNSLKKQELIVTSDKYNKLPMDKTLWYSINYDVLNRVTRPSSQNDQTSLSICIDEQVNLTRAIPETTQENNTETTTNDPVAVVVKFYQQNIAAMMSPFEMEKLAQDASEFGSDLVLYAMEIALTSNKRTYRYIEGILKRWRSEGVTHIDQVKHNNEQAASVEEAHDEQDLEARREAKRRERGLI